jgi:microcystin-dependent protein
MPASPFIGEILIFAGNFAPRGYAFCNGQVLSISQNTALFSILGTTYGGNGQTNFALPNLQSRFPIHPGTGQGLSTYGLGDQGGLETVVMSLGQMPTHGHLVNPATSATTKNPAGAVPGFTAAGASYAAPPSGAPMHSSMISLTGGSQPHQNLPPYLALNFCIALEGIFPSRN